jgi:DNA-binding NarL/FixJ family response regulator
MNPVPVVVIDDHPVFLQGLMMIIGKQKGYSIVGEAGTIHGAMELIEKSRPEVAIVDLNLGDEDGLELVKLIRKHYPGVRTLVLSMLNEQYYAERSLAAGARGYIMKEEAAETLIAALSAVVAGHIWLSPKEQTRCLETLFPATNSGSDDSLSLIGGLTDRQLQILTLMGKGNSSVQIAEKLFISRKTVEAHKGQIKDKLKCRTARDLGQLAIEWASRS